MYYMKERNTDQVYTGCILVVCRLYSGCIQPVYWLYAGCIQAVFWLYTGCIFRKNETYLCRDLWQTIYIKHVHKLYTLCYLKYQVPSSYYIIKFLLISTGHVSFICFPVMFPIIFLSFSYHVPIMFLLCFISCSLTMFPYHVSLPCSLVLVPKMAPFVLMQTVQESFQRRYKKMRYNF